MSDTKLNVRCSDTNFMCLAKELEHNQQTENVGAAEENIYDVLLSIHYVSVLR